MASIDFKKIKTAGEVKAMLRHSDSEERLKHGHSNEDIDKALTENNVNYTKLTYRQSCERYDKRIKFLDEQPGANKRSDRVTAFGLNIPCCEGMTQEEAKRFFNDICKTFQDEFGGKNVISAIAHFDEVHSYVDHGELKESRPHLHFYVVPEVDGKLNGKKFSAKKRMIELNQKIDTLAREKYNKKFLTHEAPRKRSVEELKAITNEAQEKRLAERNELEREIKRLTAEERGNRVLFEDTKENFLKLLDITKDNGYNFDDFIRNQQRAGAVNRIIKKALKAPFPELERIEKLLEPTKKQTKTQSYDLEL